MYKIIALLNRLGLACLIVFLTGFFDEAGGKVFNEVWDSLGWHLCSDPYPSSHRSQCVQ